MVGERDGITRSLKAILTSLELKCQQMEITQKRTKVHHPNKVEHKK